MKPSENSLLYKILGDKTRLNRTTNNGDMAETAKRPVRERVYDIYIIREKLSFLKLILYFHCFKITLPTIDLSLLFTCLFRSSVILEIWIFFLPILDSLTGKILIN